MNRIYTLSCLSLLALCLVGCPAAETPPAGDVASGDGEATTNAADGPAHGHSHDDADALTWEKEDLAHEGYVIHLGLHGPHLHSGEEAEVAAIVLKDDESVADAKVFVTLLDEAGEEVIAAEQETVYEPETPDEPAHFAQASFDMPEDARRVVIRYRIELPEASEFVNDVLYKVD